MDVNTDQIIALARAAFQRGDLPAAEQHARQALDGGIDNAEVTSLLGYTARARGDLAEADLRYAAAVEHDPGEASLHTSLAEIRREQGYHAEALALFRRAMVLAPDWPDIEASLGAALLAAGQPDVALPHLEHALAVKPALIGAHGDAANCLCALNRYPESLAHYREVYRQQPANNNARYLEALALLALGDYENGWRKHECRWYAGMGRDLRRDFAAPAWLGEDNLTGRTILLHAEQGMGDTIQFVRYASMVAAMGASVLLETQAPLKPLLAELPCMAGVFARGETLPPFDTHCSLMSLPRAFRTTLESVPAQVPYLHANQERTAHWQERLGPADGRRRIAIAWSGTKSVWNRDIALAALAPLLRRDDCAFHVAQTEIRAADRATLDAMPFITDHSADLHDFADTAALLSLMDHVISVDTALVHLGGAMAVPTWALLPFGCDYRWMTEGTTSPWYPTMRLFRQPALHDWAGVIDAVGRAIDQELA